MDQCDILKEEFVALRGEITQSIKLQHQITLAGYALTGAVVGYIIGSSNAELRALAVVPIILYAMACLWALECNRMVRAGCYIAYELWPTLTKAAGISECEGWEKWIRRQKDEARGFTKNQDLFQQVAILWIPAILSVVAIAIAVATVRADFVWFTSLLGYLGATIFAWYRLLLLIRTFSDLRATIPRSEA